MKLRALLLALGRMTLFVALLALPLVLRVGYYYRQPAQVRLVPMPDLSSVRTVEQNITPFDSIEPVSGSGQVLIDRAHENKVTDAELNVLLARLTAQGMETVSLYPGDDLVLALRTAEALVVISPHQTFSPSEAESVEQFVAQGGRVLLITDPSRYAVQAIEDELYGELYVTRSDVAAVNSLASLFGLSFVDDYLYNTVENEGNYQYIILQDFSPSPITEGLQKVVFYAAHSLSVSEQPLIRTSRDTTSSVSEQSGGLTSVALGGDGRVLAVTDWTFMTEPYNAVADNNRLIANIARFVASGIRTFGLTEFPHFFNTDVDLVLMQPAEDEARPGTVVENVSALQKAFKQADKELYWWTTQHSAHDTFYLGLYSGLNGWPEVQEILSEQGISLTLETMEQKEATPTPTPRVRASATPEADSEVSPTPTPEPRDWIHLPSLGWVDARKTILFYQNESAGRQLLVVLAFNDEDLSAATQRLLAGDLDGCLVDEDRLADPKHVAIALCPTAYEARPTEQVPSIDETATPEPDEVDEGTPTPKVEGDILIVADDDGEGMYEWWTSAYMLYDVATAAGYQPVIWSTSLDGDVTPEMLPSYRAVLWCTGDYQDEGGNPTVDEIDMLFEYLYDEAADSPRGVLFVGAFLGVAEDREQGLLLDIQVVQADHPLAAEFEAGQVIVLERFTADEDYRPYVTEETDTESTIWSRGPGSEFPGAAVIAAAETEDSSARLVVMSVPLYLLPYEDGLQLGTNIVLWLAGEN